MCEKCHMPEQITVKYDNITYTFSVGQILWWNDFSYQVITWEKFKTRFYHITKEDGYVPVIDSAGQISGAPVEQIETLYPSG